jgi:hypothetical protein
MRCGIRDVQWTWSLGLKKESPVETATYMSLDGNFNSCQLDALLTRADPCHHGNVSPTLIATTRP